MTIESLPTDSSSVREKLLAAGLSELHLHGIQDFSVRRIATACGVSTAAPYKHFEDKNHFISCIIDSVIHHWEEKIPDIIAKHPDDLGEQLVEVVVAYVQFLVENAHFRSTIMLKSPALDERYVNMRLHISRTTRDLVDAYAKTTDFSPETIQFKLYLCRSLMYGAALLFDNGEMEYNDKNLDYVRRGIRRELQLP